jgi:hypothetical protein
MSDGNVWTQWSTPGRQQGHERFVADLGASHELSGIMLAHRSPGTFPRALLIEVSADGLNWDEVWRGETSTRALEAAIARPGDLMMRIPFSARAGRYVRVTQTGVANWPWSVAEFRVVTSPD